MDNINLSGIGGTGASHNADNVQRNKAPQQTAPASQTGDQVKISDEGAYVSSLVSKVAEMSPSRPEVVNSLHEKVRGGNYPPPAIVEGMSRLMGQALQAEKPEPES